MKFPNYWVRVKNDRGTVTARGWSDTSEQEALQLAKQRLSRILSALPRNSHSLQRYPYVADGVICEQVIERFHNADRETAVISRNAYGALILNTPRVLIADLDIPKTPPRSRWLDRWLGRLLPPRLTEADHLERLAAWQRSEPGWTLRVYRTAAGLRIFVVNRVFEELSGEILGLLQQWNCDRCYVQLCRIQQCFRARLTPKPWRTAAGLPPAKFPFPSAAAEQSFEQWLAKYLEEAKHYRIAELIATFGEDRLHPEAMQIVEIHDSFCCQDSHLPLA